MQLSVLCCDWLIWLPVWLFKCVFLQNMHPLQCNTLPEATGWEEPAASFQQKNLQPRFGDEARDPLGGLGPAERVHQDISVKEHS